VIPGGPGETFAEEESGHISFFLVAGQRQLPAAGWKLWWSWAGRFYRKQLRGARPTNEGRLSRRRKRERCHWRGMDDRLGVSRTTLGIRHFPFQAGKKGCGWLILAHVSPRFFYFDDAHSGGSAGKQKSPTVRKPFLFVITKAIGRPPSCAAMRCPSRLKDFLQCWERPVNQVSGVLFW